MKKYEVEIHFVNGDKVQARVDARNRKDALRRVKETAQYEDFASQCGDVVAEYAEPVYIEPVSNDDFVVTAILNKPWWHMVANMKKGIRVDFKDGMYNETQRIVRFGGEEMSALDEATALREIGDFMYENFKRLI